MNRVSALLLMASLVMAACQNKTPQSLEDIDRLAELMKVSIRNSPSDIKVEGTIYYVSSAGDDSKDGLSPENALKTLDKVNNLKLVPGDAVLFNRGDLWRGRVVTKPGVTYSAYGEGEKPRLYGSPFDAAVEGKWELTDVPDVYVYDRIVKGDVGTLVFNHGAEGCAFKVMKRRMPEGVTLHVETGEMFRDYKDLKRDLDFYHDHDMGGKIFICSTKGNPAERFNSIELNEKFNLIQARTDVHVDNLCLKYVGAHAIGAGSVNTLTVTNCEIGWIGGSIQGYEIFGRNLPTRYGNGVEIYGGCKNYLVDNCYIYQIYDAAITHQHLGDSDAAILMRNVSYTNNLVEDCVYAFEYFLGAAANGSERLMENVLIDGNIARCAGYGWGIQRPDKETPALVKSWVNYNRADNFVISNNIFDRSVEDLLNITADDKQWLPKLSDNLYVQYRDAAAGRLGANAEGRGIESDPFWNSIRTEDMRYKFTEGFASLLTEMFGEEEPELLILER